MISQNAMPAPAQPDLEVKIAHILALDGVGYSVLLITTSRA
jgi:hypothetical protein